MGIVHNTHPLVCTQHLYFLLSLCLFHGHRIVVVSALASAGTSVQNHPPIPHQLVPSTCLVIWLCPYSPLVYSYFLKCDLTLALVCFGFVCLFTPFY